MPSGKWEFYIAPLDFALLSTNPLPPDARASEKIAGYIHLNNAVENALALTRSKIKMVVDDRRGYNNTTPLSDQNVVDFLRFIRYFFSLSLEAAANMPVLGWSYRRTCSEARNVRHAIVSNHRLSVIETGYRRLKCPGASSYLRAGC
jgi:hypothetical protein